MIKFTFKLTHDNGNINISTYADNLQTAEHIIMNAENCPPSAMKLINEKRC